jgi:hypothetical protein
MTGLLVPRGRTWQSTCLPRAGSSSIWPLLSRATGRIDICYLVSIHLPCMTVLAPGLVRRRLWWSGWGSLCLWPLGVHMPPESDGWLL